MNVHGFIFGIALLSFLLAFVVTYSRHYEKKLIQEAVVSYLPSMDRKRLLFLNRLSNEVNSELLTDEEFRSFVREELEIINNDYI